MKKRMRGLAPTQTGGYQPQGRAGINSSAIFQALLRRERSRSDRDGSKFSLAVFDVSGMNSHGRGIEKLADQIRMKMRSIDEVGWIDSRSI
jgi:hypothetical protein